MSLIIKHISGGHRIWRLLFLLWSCSHERQCVELPWCQQYLIIIRGLSRFRCDSYDLGEMFKTPVTVKVPHLIPMYLWLYWYDPEELIKKSMEREDSVTGVFEPLPISSDKSSLLIKAKEVKMIKEVKKSDSSWYFARGNVFGLILRGQRFLLSLGCILSRHFK